MTRGAFEHVCDGFDAAVRVVREAADRPFNRIVEGKMIEEQEGIEQVADTRRDGTAQLNARAFDRILRLDNLRDFSWVVHMKTDEVRMAGITSAYSSTTLPPSWSTAPN
jgi:uncharacterized UPF0160 family protein